MEIIFTHDFLTHSITNTATYHSWFIHLFNPVIKELTGNDIIELKNYQKNQKIFDRETFFKLSNMIPNDKYFIYDKNKILDVSWDYLFEFIDKDTFVFGFELGLDLREKFTEKGIKFINFWIHSFKLFDDVAFMINTNNKDIFDILQKYKIPQLKFKLYSEYWKIYINEHNLSNIDNICNNSAIFIGQTFKDISVKKDDKFLNILDYKDKLEQMSKIYEKIYYLPHPLVTNISEVDEYINSVGYIEKIDNIPAYCLLASDKIKKVLGISSSVLYEAQFFGKDVEYLYQPLFNIDGDFGLNTFVSVIDNYFTTVFWQDILSCVIPIKKEITKELLFSDLKNKFRDLKDLYWSFSKLDKTKILENKLKNEINALVDEKEKRINQLRNIISNDLENKINISEDKTGSEIEELKNIISNELENKSNKLNEITIMLKELEDKYNKLTCYTFLEKIFSVKNKIKSNIKHKVITILGIKFKFKTK